jgi:ceramide synthetase
MVSQFTDVRRKDFWAMFIHHIATIILIGYSYTVNFVRNGILVLMCHDPCDVFMEAAKLFKYAGVQVLSPSLSMQSHTCFLIAL